MLMASVETDIAARPTYPPADPPGRMQDSAASGPDSCSLQRSPTLVRNSAETFPRRRDGEAGPAGQRRPVGPPDGGTRHQFTEDELAKNRCPQKPTDEAGLAGSWILAKSRESESPRSQARAASWRSRCLSSRTDSRISSRRRESTGIAIAGPRCPRSISTRREADATSRLMPGCGDSLRRG